MRENRLIALGESLGFNGVAYVRRKDEIIFRHAFGKACFEWDVPLQPETLMRIASISKQITAAMVLQLHVAGLLDIDAPMERFFPDYPNAGGITLHHLLSNSSGIPNFDLDANFYGALALDDPFFALVDMFKDLPVTGRPGEAYAYSNSGYLLLTRIVEIVTGMPFEDALKTHLFDKLGMHHTGFDHLERIVPRKAFPYDVRDGRIVRAKPVDLRIAAGGGALYSTVEDLSLWNQALYANRVLPREWTEAMLSPHVRINDTTSYGYGVFLEERTDEKTLLRRNYHTGGGPGVRSINAVYPASGLMIILLSNVNDRNAFAAFLDALEEACSDAAETMPKSVRKA